MTTMKTISPALRRARCAALAPMLKALAHPVRLCIATGLLHHECHVTRIVDGLGLPQPVVSQHLAVLARAGIITARHDGTRRCYRIVNPRGRRILRVADAILSSPTGVVI